MFYIERFCPHSKTTLIITCWVLSICYPSYPHLLCPPCPPLSPRTGPLGLLTPSWLGLATEAALAGDQGRGEQGPEIFPWLPPALEPDCVATAPLCSQSHSRVCARSLPQPRWCGLPCIVTPTSCGAIFKITLPHSQIAGCCLDVFLLLSSYSLSVDSDLAP